MKLNKYFVISWFCFIFFIFGISILILLKSTDRYMIFLAGSLFSVYLIELIGLFKEVKNA